MSNRPNPHGSRHRPTYSGLYYDQFADDSAWIRDKARIGLPPLPGCRSIRVVGEFRPHPDAAGRECAFPRLELGVPGGGTHRLEAGAPGTWSVDLDLPGSAAQGGSELLLGLRDVGFTNFLAWAGRVGGQAGLQRYRKQNKNRQLRIKRVETDAGETVYDFADRQGPYSLAFARRNSPVGINILGFLTADLGIGESARSMVKAADAAGIPAALIALRLPCKNRQGDLTYADRLQESNPHAVNIVHVDPPAAHDLESNHGARFFQDRHNIAYFAWESPEFPDAWISSFRHFQEVWCPSEFARQSIAWKAPIAVHAMPHAIQFARPQESRAELRKRFGLAPEPFLFLALFDLNSYALRKNPHAAIDAFRAAALKPATAGLVIKVQNAAGNPAEFAALQSGVAALPGAVLISDTLSRDDTYRLEAACDAFVSLHRAEGFGFAVAEAMYLGKPVISTDWSATAEFVDATNGCPVGYKLKPLERSSGPYQRGSTWAEADVGHAAEWMRRLSTEPELGRRLGAAGRETIERRFSPAAIGARYRQRLDNLALW